MERRRYDWGVSFCYSIHIVVYRSASKPEITKKFRKLASKWHPDKYDGDDKKMAEKKFIDIAAAKEVLTDPGKSGLHFSSVLCKFG